MGLFKKREKSTELNSIVNNEHVSNEVNENTGDFDNNHNEEAANDSDTDIEIKSEYFEDETDSNEAFDKLMDYVAKPEVAARFTQYSRGLLSKENILNDIKSYIESDIKMRGNKVNELLDIFERYEWGYFKLTPLIDDKGITDITVEGYDKVFIHKNDGTRHLTTIKFRNKQEYESFVERIVNRNGASNSTSNAIAKFTDDTSNEDWILRIDLATQFVMDSGTSRIHIRKTPKKKYTLDFLVDNGTLTRKQAEWIIEHVKKMESFLICGGNGNGKTTFMNAIIEYIPYNASIMCVQESKELFLTDSNRQFASLHPVKRSSSGGTEYSLGSITISLGLVSDIDVFINGEIKGDEASDFLMVAHNGSTVYASVHSETEEDAFVRLSDYAKRKISYTESEMEYMLRHIHNVILIENKKVKSISTTSWNRDTKRVETKRVDI